MTSSSVIYLTMGAVFGLTAGISPGPLLTLVITETLRHNRKEGIKIAVAPLITDLPIIMVTYLIFSRISHLSVAMAVISLLGGIYFSYLAFETIRTRGLESELKEHKPDSLKKGITANFLNPNPYMFWLTAGIPTAFRAYESGLLTVILYFFLFYLFLTGSKIGVAFLVEGSKSFLKNRSYMITLKILGVILLGFALYFFYQGLIALKTPSR